MALSYCTLKTRKRRFQTICSHRSLALSTVASAAETIASPLTSSQNRAAEARGLVRLVTNRGYSQSRRIPHENTKVEENSHNPAARR